MAHLLVSCGAMADLSARGNQDPVLFPAIRLGDLDLIGLLLNQGVDLGITVRRSQGLTCEATALTIAAGFQNESLDNATALGLVSYVLGAHTSRASPVDISALITPDVLIAAAEAGNCDVIKFLVGLSPNVGFSNSIGISALHTAAWKGCVDTCRLLLELGCPVNSSSAKSSPLHIACARDRTSVAELLMLNGAAIDAAMDLDEETFHRLNLDPDESDELEWDGPLIGANHSAPSSPRVSGAWLRYGFDPKECRVCRRRGCAGCDERYQRPRRQRRLVRAARFRRRHGRAKPRR
jgi:hypothetical protein